MNPEPAVNEPVTRDEKPKRVPRFCPSCGQPDPEATPTTMWCPRCPWTVQR